MSITIKTTVGVEAPANFLASAILEKLNRSEKVLWFVTGGSSMDVAVGAAKIISQHRHSGLTITLTDERYGSPGHMDSNWQQLLQKGFGLSEAKLLPILTGDSLDVTTEKFNTILGQELTETSFKIGLFGVGADGHTAGILPNSVAVKASGWAVGYKTEKFDRITITPNTISKLDEAVVFMQGSEKWKMLEDLQQEIDIESEPAQILKNVPELIIFSDYKSK